MNSKVITSESDYKKAVKRAMDIFHAKPDTKEARELTSLLAEIKDFEDKNFHLPTTIFLKSA